MSDIQVHEDIEGETGVRLVREGIGEYGADVEVTVRVSDEGDVTVLVNGHASVELRA